MSRILVTGHKGLLGSACVRHFQQCPNNEVITAGSHWATGGVDYRDREATDKLVKLYKPDIIIHCAAKVGGVKANKEQPVEFLSDNLLIQTNVIDAAHANDVNQLVFVGTSCMFPRDAVLPVQEESLLTGRLDDSVEAYAIAKIAGWRLCKAYYEQYGRQYITVNPCNIYGPNDNYSEKAHVIPALIRKVYENRGVGRVIRVWGDGSAIREFIYSDDVASAISFALEKWHSPEVLSIGTGVSTTIHDLALAVYQTLEAKSQIIFDESQPTGIPRKTFDVSKLLGLGWTPKCTLFDGLRIVAADFQRNVVDYCR